MDRREFFRRGINKVSETAVKEAERRARKKAANWIRPPYAIRELDFLLACTRCAKCIEACPHGTIFPLPLRLGAEVVNTPALDLLSHACHLCADWPCVTACEPHALQHPSVEDDEALPLPRLSHVSIDTDICLPYSGPECGACRMACPVSGALLWQMEKPSIDTARCTGCALCREACITSPKAINVVSLYRAAEDIDYD